MVEYELAKRHLRKHLIKLRAPVVETVRPGVTLSGYHSTISAGPTLRIRGETMTGKTDKNAKRTHDCDFSYTQNRELSWLRFDNRVLDEATDETVPLFERLKFSAIFESNLDEFFMVRVGGLSDLATLKHQPKDNKSNLTPAEQVDLVLKQMPELCDRWCNVFSSLEKKLETFGVHRAQCSNFTPEERTFVTRYFQAYVSPVISPLVIDPRHPFPNLRNGALYIICSIEGGEDESNLLGLIEIPSSMNRVVEIPQEGGDLRYVLLEDIIMSSLDTCFGSYRPLDRALIRVTRNADIDPDGEGVEEEEDYRLHMKKVLKMRLRLKPVMLSVSGDLQKSTIKTIRRALGLHARSVLHCTIPLDLGYVFGLEGKLPAATRTQLLFPPFQPQPNATIDAGRSMREQVLEGDKLLFYPYESMGPFLNLVHEAAFDDGCISIRITLYRVAKQSHLCESLISAAENGKEVTVLMELRARFDEQNNIEWAERLEEAGCTVIYGSEGFKCHSKICQLTYREGMALTRLTLLGTGNFNEKTAKLYSDFMLMTAHPGIGEDANLFFRNLSLGNLRGDYRYLGVAPAGLKPLIMRGLNREIDRALAGEPARVFFKLNSLTDREVIDKIAEASCAGVTVDMIIRGISCLKPGIPGKTENVHVRSIVGRFLEHARVYAFGVDSDMIYLSSADMMTRNTEHRVEIAYPVLDPTCRDLVREYMAAQLKDNVKARELTSEGTWSKVEMLEGTKPFNSQEYLLKLACRKARIAAASASKTTSKAATRPASAASAAAPAPAAVPAAPAPAPAAAPSTVPAATEADHAPAPAITAVADTQTTSPSENDDAARNTTASVSEPHEETKATTAAETAPEQTGSSAPYTSSPASAAAEETPVEPVYLENSSDRYEAKHAAPTAAKTAASGPAKSERTTLAKRKPGRLQIGLGLIGLGLKTLITGKGPKKQ